MQASFWQQYTVIVRQGLRAELADLERVISPVLFAVTMLLVFSFALGEVDDSYKLRIYLAETYVTLFFALQLAFSRLFEPDRQDRVFDLMRTYPVSYSAWYLGKYTLVLLLGVTTLVPTMLFGALLNATPAQPLFSWTVLALAGLALTGLAAVGVLLSTLTLKANARQILYPLLYFPLTTPVLLGAVQASLLYLEAGQMTGPATSWVRLLLAFNAIYFTLGILLFSELVDES